MGIHRSKANAERKFSVEEYKAVPQVELDVIHCRERAHPFDTFKSALVDRALVIDPPDTISRLDRRII
jgi:hypothetical protein